MYLQKCFSILFLSFVFCVLKARRVFLLSDIRVVIRSCSMPQYLGLQLLNTKQTQW